MGDGGDIDDDDNDNKKECATLLDVTGSAWAKIYQSGLVFFCKLKKELGWTRRFIK